MKKFLILITMMFFSVVSRADECAKNVNELKTLVGNSAISLNWRENIKNDPLALKLSDGPGVLRLKLTNSKGLWADVTGVICKKGTDSYEARVSNIVWGPAAPGVVKGRKINTMSIKLPYQTLLKVSVRVLINFGFEFSPI